MGTQHTETVQLWNIELYNYTAVEHNLWDHTEVGIQLWKTYSQPLTPPRSRTSTTTTSITTNEHTAQDSFDQFSIAYCTVCFSQSYCTRPMLTCKRHKTHFRLQRPILIISFRLVFFLYLPPPPPGRLTFTWWGCYGLRLRHKPTELAHSLFNYQILMYISDTLWPLQLYFIP